MSAISTGESRGADKGRRWTRAKRVACSLAFAATLAWAPDDAVRGETASEATERRTKLAAVSANQIGAGDPLRLDWSADTAGYVNRTASGAQIAGSVHLPPGNSECDPFTHPNNLVPV